LLKLSYDLIPGKNFIFVKHHQINGEQQQGEERKIKPLKCPILGRFDTSGS
jgi:hypothetical protein